MLKVPAFRTVDGVTVYADDTLWHRFYPVADQPRVRLDADGQPVFLLVKYALSDEELARNPTLPRGGGYLNVDVVFELDDAQREAVRANLHRREGRQESYSSSLPTGTPRARRVTLTPRVFSPCAMTWAVVSPSAVKLVARITSRTTRSPCSVASMRSNSFCRPISRGPTPSSGLSLPISTKYRPL